MAHSAKTKGVSPPAKLPATIMSGLKVERIDGSDNGFHGWIRTQIAADSYLDTYVRGDSLALTMELIRAILFKKRRAEREYG